MRAISPKRVAFVLAGLGPGGAERVIALLSGALLRAGWQVSIIAFDAPGDPVYHELAPEVELLRLNVPPGAGRRSIAQAARRVRALRKTVRQLQPAVLVSFLTKINVISLLACRGLAIPVIVSERNNPRRQRANPLWRLLLAVLYPRAAAIVMQTERSKSLLPPSQRQRALVLPNPILLPDRLPAPSGERRITAVGRLEAQKGFDLLIRAFASIAPHHPDWTLLIWGEGPLRAELEAQIAQLGIAGQVRLAGRSATPGGWIDPGGIFVLSSRFEGFPNVLAEAMAAGMAVVAFDCDFGPRELIHSGMDGILVPAEDVQILSTELMELLADSQRCVQIGRKARKNSDQFRSDTICAKWVDLLGAFSRQS